MTFYDPPAALREFWRKHKFYIEVFAAAYLFGLVTHLYMFTNKFFNYFELGNIFADMSFTQGDTVAQGRWFLPVATNFLTGFSMPLINGLISLFYVTLSAVLAVDLLRIRSRLYAALFCFAFAAFPGYACTLSYGVNTDAITLGVLLCALGAWLYVKYKYGFLPAVILIGCGLGAYQTYLSVSIGFIYMLLFFEAYEKRIEWKAFLWKAVKAGCMLAGGFLFYYGMLKLSCILTHVSLTDYHGVDSMTSFTLKGIAKGLVYSYGYFLSYFFSTRYLYTAGRIACNALGGAVFVFLTGRRILEQAREKNKCSAWMLGLLSCLLPLGVNATPFLMADRVGAGVDRYMIFSIMLLWAMLMKLLDLTRTKAGGEAEGARARRRTLCLQWAGTVSILAAAVSSAVICNEAYHRMEAATQTTASYLNRIAVRLEALEEWQQGMPVYFANTKPFMSRCYEVEIAAYDRMLHMPGTELSPHYNERGVARYFRTYLHMPIPDAGGEAKESIERSKEFEAMPAYPAEGCIRIINDTIVIKLCESEGTQ